MEGVEEKKKEREVTNEPKGCGCWRAGGSMSDHQPLDFLPPQADNFTNSLTPTMLRYDGDLS